MREIIERFEGQTTGRISRVRGELRDDHLLIWLLKWDDEGGHPHVPIVRIRQAGGSYKVVWFQGRRDRPSDELEYTDREALYAAIERAVGARDAE